MGRKKISQNIANILWKDKTEDELFGKNKTKTSQQYSMAEGFMVCDFTASGPKQLAIIEKMNAQVFQDILLENKAICWQMKLNKTCVMQQHKDPKHKSK